MTFSDIFKSGFLENVGAVSLLDMFLAMGLSFLLGVFIFFIYKKTYAGVMYSATFGVTLIAMTMISTLVILAITSNVVLSLGMVGALSIVRFRSAIKEPLDLAFLFWSVAGGIVLAAGLIELAILDSVFIGLMLLLFVNRKGTATPYVMVVSCTDAESEKAVDTLLRGSVERCTLKGKTVRAGCIDRNYEVRLKGDRSDFVNESSALGGVVSAVLVSYNG
ncbi:MAG: DUF4956 domain-containing protein, partial [Clostridiales bacterium]|nr:DUF4956 domain-containing protein [Candidatus Apopatocola equi]